jgi:hypothetical protein
MMTLCLIKLKKDFNSAVDNSTGTYTSRTRRGVPVTEPPLNIAAVEKRLIAELGDNVCVFENVCDQYAEHARTLRESNHVLDWEQVLK